MTRKRGDFRPTNRSVRELQLRKTKSRKKTSKSAVGLRPAVFEEASIDILRAALTRLEKGFLDLDPMRHDIKNILKFKRTVFNVADRLKDNYPYFHPLYAGQMLKPPHPIARAAYMLAMWLNPNNHALDGGRASSAMEKEAVAEIAKMFGWRTHVGHLASGGTMANLEALWIAGQLNPGKKVVGSSQAHYTHSRISSVLGLKYEPVACDRDGRMDIVDLTQKLSQGNVGTVVATIGSTATGSVDPLPQLIELRKKYGFRLHADAAYGGYFMLANNLSSKTKSSFERLAEMDSLVVDPHKHGLQPYGCGCILFRDPAVARFYKHDSPYTYFTSDELHLGEISLECSRAGASAVGLWATQKFLPLVGEGEFAKSLEKGHSAALKLYGRLKTDSRFLTAFAPELDIVVWVPAAGSVTEASELSRMIFEEAARRNLHLALAELPTVFFDTNTEIDAATVTCLRSVLMKPEHLDWIDRIWERLVAATEAALKRDSLKKQVLHQQD